MSAAGFSVRSHFADPTPLNPTGPLVRGLDGAFYGTSCGGGVFNAGTVFRMPEGGAVSVLHSFTYWDGFCPASGFTLGNDGTFYGTARSSLLGQGSIFRITPAGGFTLLRILGPGDGRSPVGLLLADDGNLYGTTTRADSVTAGAVFRLTPAGSYTVLHAFGLIPRTVRYPLAGLAQGTDRALYGTTGFGTGERPPVFRLSLAGDFTAWQPFGELNAPLRLIRAADGGFLGTTLNNVFRMTTAAEVTPLYTLNAMDGVSPLTDLLRAADGRFYGTTWEGGTGGFGTIYGVTPDGLFEKLHDFSGSGGEKSLSPLFEASPGVFYGMTTSGGPGQGGVIFRLAMNPPPF